MWKGTTSNNCWATEDSTSS